MTTTKAVRVCLLPDAVRREAFAEASRFRGEFYECLTARRDELFELADAVLCADGAVKSPVDLTLLPEHRRGHGAMYGGLNDGRIITESLRTVLAGLSLPRFDGGRLVLAVDVSPWLRSDAPCSAERLFCHVYGRAKTVSQFIPGWPYSFVAVLEPGSTSWTAILDAVRLGPADDATAVTAAQPRGVVEQLIAAGQWQAGNPDIVIVSDAGYVVTRQPGTNGRPPKHGPEFRFTKPETWPEPAITTVTDTTNYGKAETQAWDRVHPRLLMARSRRRTSPGRGHVDATEGAALADGPERPARVVMVLEDRRHPGRGGPFLAGMSPSLRSGAHLPLREADPRMDHPETPHPRGGGPLDLDPDRRPHPAPARPAPRRRPPPALGEADHLRPAHPGPGPPRVQEHPRSPRLPGPCPQTPR
ncbi:transposase [Streptomyces sp. CBMA29]|uniref:transposase n=1 Tax=Streptomyces sp. CBMA29 TaxID=1896314 RepID=UPI003980001E